MNVFVSAFEFKSSILLFVQILYMYIWNKIRNGIAKKCSAAVSQFPVQFMRQKAYAETLVLHLFLSLLWQYFFTDILSTAFFLQLNGMSLKHPHFLRTVIFSLGWIWLIKCHFRLILALSISTQFVSAFFRWTSVWCLFCWP